MNKLGSPFRPCSSFACSHILCSSVWVLGSSLAMEADSEALRDAGIFSE